MRSTGFLAAALLLGLSGCVSRLADQSCQDRGYSPGSGLYGACYSSAAPAIVQTYGRAVQSTLQLPYVTAPIE
jgi:hypothetical protein